jgi:hypothetical protein
LPPCPQIPEKPVQKATDLTCTIQELPGVCGRKVIQPFGDLYVGLNLGQGAVGNGKVLNKL